MERFLLVMMGGVVFASFGCADGTDFVPDAGGSDADLLCVADSDCEGRCEAGVCITVSPTPVPTPSPSARSAPFLSS